MSEVTRRLEATRVYKRLVAHSEDGCPALRGYREGIKISIEKARLTAKLTCPQLLYHFQS